MVDYSDPLFSIILLAFVGFLISLGAYLFDLRTKRLENDSLLGFLDKFETKECVIDTKTLPYEPNMLRPLSLLAKSHELNGEYHKAISLYLYLAKGVDDENHKYALMEHLGDTYVKAGLLERAKGVYLDILSNKPRRISTLYSLGDVYHILRDYDKALETTIPLKILGEDTTKLEEFFRFEMLLQNKKLTQDEQSKEMQELAKNSESMYRQIFSQLLNINSKEAWGIFDESKVHDVLDILWFRDEAQIDKDIIGKHEILETIYYAKGYSDKIPKDSGMFALDILVASKKGGNSNGTLNFNYICDECKHSFVSYFKRCPNCKSVYSIKVEEQIGKQQNKTNHSLL